MSEGKEKTVGAVAHSSASAQISAIGILTKLMEEKHDLKDWTIYPAAQACTILCASYAENMEILNQEKQKSGNCGHDNTDPDFNA